MRFRKDARLMLEATIRIRDLKAENDELRRVNLDLGRACLNLCNGLLVEINDPGTITEDHVLAAATDWADQIARMEEHTV